MGVVHLILLDLKHDAVFIDEYLLIFLRKFIRKISKELRYHTCHFICLNELLSKDFFNYAYDTFLIKICCYCTFLSIASDIDKYPEYLIYEYRIIDDILSTE